MDTQCNLFHLVTCVFDMEKSVVNLHVRITISKKRHVYVL